MSNALGPVVQRIDHVGIAVPDLDEAIRWYAAVFDARLVHEEANEDQGVREALLAFGADNVHNAQSSAQTADVSAASGQTQLQLLAPLTHDSPVGRFLANRGPGLQQLAYTVADLDAATDVLRERGVEVLYAEGRRGTNGTRVNFVHPRDAGGVLVELVEHPLEV